MRFYITNFPHIISNKADAFTFDFTGCITFKSRSILFYIDGYIIPRNNIFNKYKNHNQYELISDLYNKYEERFIHYIKGVFNIVIINEDKFLIFNDRHSIKKVFIYKQDIYYYISNDLKLIKKHFSVKINNENIALFCLTSHFFDGNTIFQNTKYTSPASKLSISHNKLIISSYWEPSRLLKEQFTTPKITTVEFSHFWSILINNYIKYLQPKSISITLTGGNDSRMVLTPLLNQGYSLHTFSFGNPKSKDVVIANRIAEKSKLRYKNYFVEKPSKEWLLNQSIKLIDIGSTLINLHRAHRNDALEKEKFLNPDTEILFTGLMGGEYLKEPSYDDIILPKLFYDLSKVKNDQTGINIIEDKLKTKGLKTEKIDIPTVFAKFNSFLKFQNCFNEREKKFILTYFFYGSAHHSQDSTIFNYHCKRVVNPFMDIDFLEELSRSKYWYINKPINPLDKLFHSRFIVKITNELAPELSNIPYAKKGQYTANDLLHRPLFYIVKRIKYYLINNNHQFQPNFPMGNWLYEFSKEQLEKLHPSLEDIFNKSILNKRLEYIKGYTTEENWHIITNLLNLSLYLYEYEKN